MFASFRTISFTFEAVRGEYLSRTQRATQRPAILSMLQMEIYGKPYVRRIYIYIYIGYDINYRPQCIIGHLIFSTARPADSVLTQICSTDYSK